MADADILFAFADMQSVKRQFRNDQVIMAEGAKADRFGIVLEGCARRPNSSTLRETNI